MAGKLDALVKSMGLEKTIQKNVSTGRSSGVTNEDLNRKHQNFFAEETARKQQEAAAQNVMRKVQSLTKSMSWQKQQEDKMNSLLPFNRSAGPQGPGPSDVGISAKLDAKGIVDIADKAKERQSARISSEVAQREKQIQDLQGQKELYGYQVAPSPKNKAIDSKIAQLEAESNAMKGSVADVNQITLALLPAEDRKGLETYVNERKLDYYNAISQGVSGYFDPTAGLPGRAETNAAGLAQKYGWDTVLALAETLERQQNAEATAQAQQEGAAMGQAHPILSSIASIPMNVMSGVSAIGERIRGIGTSTGQYPTLDPNNAGNLPAAWGGAVQGQVASDIEGDGSNGWRNAGSLLYRGTMSAAESGLRAVTGSHGNMLLSGLNSLEENVAKASAQGASPQKAVALGLTNAVIEAATEKIPLDNLLDAAKAGGGGAKKIIKDILKQAGIEATTEVISLVGTTLAEAAILQDDGEKARYIQSRMEEGADYQTANKEWFQSLLSEAADTAIISGISGALMSGASTGVNFLSNTQSDAQADTPLQGEAADPRHVAAQQEQAARTQAEAQQVQPTAAQEANPSASLLDGFDIPQDTTQEQIGPDPVADILAPVQNPQQSAVDTASAHMNMATETAAQVSLFGSSGPQTQEGLYNEAIQAYDQQRDGKGRIPEKSDFSQYRQFSPGELAAGMDGSGPEGNPGPALSYGGSTPPVSAAVPGGQREVTDQTPGIKGTVAAKVNFTGKPAYNATLSAENAQPDRASDARPMELPKTDINGNPISAVTGNAYGSKITTDELASLMEEPTARGDFSYAKISNDQATQKAMDTIAAADDWESAYNQWAKDVGAGKAGAEMTARGALFLNHFAKEGNKTQWLNTLADMQDLGTNTAQGLQAMRLIRELAPQDKVRVVKRATKRLGEQMGVDFQVDQSLYDAYNNATTDEARNAALDDIQQNIANQIPSTALDKWNALRYTNMLGNLKTNVRNVAGNVGAGAMYRVKDQVAATMEDVLHAATGGKFEKTKSHTVSRELLNACKQDFDNVSGIVSNGGKYGSQDSFSDQFIQGAMDKRRIFKSDNKILNAAMAPMEAYRKGTNWMMNNRYFGDEAFGKAAYARSLAGYLKAHGVTDADLSKVDTALMDKARAYAVQEAQEATFHDNSALARTMSNLKRDMGVFGEGIMPFTKTPANVLTRAYEFSPLGLIDTTAKAVAAAKGDVDVTGTDVINSLSKTLTGTAIFALGSWLKRQGFLTGGPDDDDEKDAFDKLNGDQNYAIRFTVGGKTYNYTFDWLTPAAMPLFMGAQLMDILDKGFENITFADLENVFTSIADPMLQMSMLQSLNDSLDNIKYTDNNLGQFFINAAVSYLTQGLSNTLVGQIERSTEKNRMTTYVDKNSQLPAWMQRQIGSLSQKIPGWDYQQTEYRNAYGETEENEGGLLYNLLSPGYISEEKSTALSQELYRLNDAVADGNVFPDTPDTTLDFTDTEGNRHEDYHLSAGEAGRLKEVTGKTAATLLSGMIETDLYKAMTDQQKADVVQKVYNYAQEVGRTEAIDGYDGMDAWMEAAREDPAKAILDKVVKASFEDGFDVLTHAWKYGKDTASAVSTLDDAYAVYSGMSKTEQNEFKNANGGRVEYYLKAREAGIPTEKFIQVYDRYNKIGGRKSTTTQKANEWSYALENYVSAGFITQKQKNTLKNSMVFRYSNVAETKKFDELVSGGVSAANAKKIGNLLDGITGTGTIDPETGSPKVTNQDKYSAIAHSDLPEKEKEPALMAYLQGNLGEKYEYARDEMRMSIEDFVDAYKVTSEYSRKKQQISAWRRMGYTAKEATNLYKLYSGKLT